MQTVFETRRARLKELISTYGTISALNLAIGWEATNPRLSQIQNRSIRSDRGTPYEMGDTTAREIERALRLDAGWLDTPPGYADKEEMRELFHVAERLEEYQLAQLVAIAATLAVKQSAQPLEANLQENEAVPVDRRAGLAAVPRVVAKKIGKGHFGPPADAAEGNSSVSSNRRRKVPRAGNAGRGR